MSLAYKKIDGGENWIYQSRFKAWHLIIISLVPIFVGYMAVFFPLVLRIVLILFGLGFSAVYGISSIPVTLVFHRATNKGQHIITEKKDGYYQHSIQK